LSDDRACRSDGAVVLAQVHAAGLHVGCEARIVVHDERDAGGAAQRRERGGLRGAQRRIGRLVAVLEEFGECQQRLHARHEAFGVRLVGRDQIQAGLHAVSLACASEAGPSVGQWRLRQNSILRTPMTDAVATAYRTWMCVVCGFIYDEAKGLPEEGIAPGTRWEDVPDTWTCPDCGVTKDDFEMMVV
jgi:rubredoxin